MMRARVAFWCCLLLFPGARAARAAEEEGKPDATVRFSARSVGAGIGVSGGSGTLTYNGKTYPFKVKGMSVGDVGITSIDATGDVFHLAKLEDFNGNFSSAGAGATVGGGAQASIMRNQSGVVMHVTATTAGANVKAGIDGIKVELEQPTAGTKGETD